MSRPSFTTAQACSIAERFYGFSAEAKPLPSYSDQNFKLTTIGGDAYVLKIANTDEPLDVLDLQQSVLEYLAEAAPPVRTPVPVRSLAGDRMIHVTSDTGRQHTAWLVTYLAGKTIGDLDECDAFTYHNLGVALGHLDRALLPFSHPAMHRVLQWDLKQGAAIRGLLSHIDGPDKRALVARALDRFEAYVLPRLPSLRACVVHNDGHAYNALIDEDERGRVSVVGLIDFGDCVHTCLVCEPAIAATYAMLEEPDLVAAARPVLAGYHSIVPLTSDDLSVLFDLIATRLCISVCLAAEQRKLAPDNAYVGEDKSAMWDALDRLAQSDPITMQRKLQLD